MGFINRRSPTAATDRVRHVISEEARQARRELRRLRQEIADALDRSGQTGSLADELRELIDDSPRDVLRPQLIQQNLRSAARIAPEDCQHRSWSLHHVGCGNEHQLICDDCGCSFDD